jgi:hypothetical protein
MPNVKLLFPNGVHPVDVENLSCRFDCRGGGLIDGAAPGEQFALQHRQ